MVETVDNAVQLIVLIGCLACAIVVSIRERDEGWYLLSGFYAAMAAGGLYWTLYLMLRADNPTYFYVSDISWIAGFLFLDVFVNVLVGKERPAQHRWVPWIFPVFCAGMCVFFMQWGDWITNAAMLAVFGHIGYSCLRGIMVKSPYAKFLVFPIVYTLLECALWTSSCFWTGDTLANPYYWIDTLISACYIVLLVAFKRTMRA